VLLNGWLAQVAVDDATGQGSEPGGQALRTTYVFDRTANVLALTHFRLWEFPPALSSIVTAQGTRHSGGNSIMASSQRAADSAPDANLGVDYVISYRFTTAGKSSRPSLRIVRC
jgi:hypothetical protein